MGLAKAAVRVVAYCMRETCRRSRLRPPALPGLLWAPGTWLPRRFFPLPLLPATAFSRPPALPGPGLASPTVMSANFVTFVRNAIGSGPGVVVVAATRTDSSSPASRGVRPRPTRANSSPTPTPFPAPWSARRLSSRVCRCPRRTGYQIAGSGEFKPPSM